MRFEPLVYSSSHADGYTALRDGRYTAPLIVVFGSPKSATTTVQNAVLAGFRKHVIPGAWGVTSPLCIWWYPKHDSTTAWRLAQLPQSQVRVVMPVRSFVDSAASIAHARDGLDLDTLRRLRHDWMAMTRVAMAPTVLAVPFEVVLKSSPQDLVRALGSRLGLEPDPLPVETWDRVYALTGLGTISGRGSNLPDSARAEALASYRRWIRESLGDTDFHEVEDLYGAAMHGAGSWFSDETWGQRDACLKGTSWA